jgi:hypothetical protein
LFDILFPNASTSLAAEAHVAEGQLVVEKQTLNRKKSLIPADQQSPKEKGRNSRLM